MNQTKDGRIVVPVNFDNKHKLVQLTFFTMDGGGYLLRAGDKNFPLSDGGQVADIVNGIGSEAMETMDALMKDAKVGTAFTIVCQIRVQPHAIIPGLGFVDQEMPAGIYGQQSHWQRLLNNWLMLLNIDSNTAQRYKPNKEGFLNLQRDIRDNTINVDKNVVESIFGNPFFGAPTPFITEEDNDVGPQGDGKVKVSHPEENRTKLS